MKRIAVLALTAALCLCAAAAQAITMTGLETESVTREWEENLFFARMQERTGIEASARAIYDEEDYQKTLLAMEKGEIPADVLFKAKLTREQERTLIDSGALVDLAPLIEENMPNLSALLEENPAWREVITLEDGRIASLPLINEAEHQVIVWINQAWLKKLGLPMPVNPQELTEALLAIKKGDPNANYKQDEIPADLLGVFEMRWLLPYFSIIADDYHLCRDAQGSIVFAPEQEGYREFVALLKEWHTLGLFGEETFTTIHNAATLDDTDDETIKSGLIVTVAPYTHVDAAAAHDYVPLLMAGPDGSVRWRDMFGAVWTGCFAVTSSCEDPAQALRWADALYGEEAAILAYAGEEGTDYQFNEAGDWSFIVDSLRTVEDIRAESIIYTGVTMPGRSPSEFLAKVDSDVDRHVLSETEQVASVSEQVTHSYLLNAADQARADEIALTLGRLVDEGIARFATGEVELNDENWKAWLESLRGAGSEELVQLFDAADKAEKQ